MREISVCYMTTNTTECTAMKTIWLSTFSNFSSLYFAFFLTQHSIDFHVSFWYHIWYMLPIYLISFVAAFKRVAHKIWWYHAKRQNHVWMAVRWTEYNCFRRSTYHHSFRSLSRVPNKASWCTWRDSEKRIRTNIVIEVGVNCQKQIPSPFNLFQISRIIFCWLLNQFPTFDMILCAFF